jgi:hypothetical protein
MRIRPYRFWYRWTRLDDRDQAAIIFVIMFVMMGIGAVALTAYISHAATTHLLLK